MIWADDIGCHRAGQTARSVGAETRIATGCIIADGSDPMRRRRHRNPHVDVPAWLLFGSAVVGLYFVAKNQQTLFAGINLPFLGGGQPPPKLCYPPAGVSATAVAPTNNVCPQGWIGPA